ncbi:hypothetical protein FAM09_11875 [Niastella caeni]|uniref:Uncharacterized protein n=1 Tax=Niastella caeni TaxID=2569763 RepID=A0A4V4H163_9BACT|nr:hypothetical protein [Niastella caeni]THU39206.1 hypothetical protein FAM09_11875 [Niastella caeni]
MKRKYIYILSGIIAIVFLVMTFLKASVQGMNSGNNGFVRKTGALSIIKEGEKEFRQPLRDIAGISGDSIFIVTAQPDKIIITDGSLGKENLIELPVTVHKKLPGNFTTRCLYPDLYIFGSNVPCVIHYNFTSGKETVYPISRAFSRSALLSPFTVVVRGFDAQFKDEHLRTINLLTGTSVEEKGITDKTEGGGFVTDGMLHYDAYTHTVVYNHFYSNKILYLDTNLHLLRTGTSIDTFSTYTAKATAKPSSKGTSFTFTSPPKLLSGSSCVSNGRLYISSRLKADNETHDRFINNAVIDVYDIKTADYTVSLYIPGVPGKRMTKFKVLGDRLFAIYDNKVVVYRIQ